MATQYTFNLGTVTQDAGNQAAIDAYLKGVNIGLSGQDLHTFEQQLEHLGNSGRVTISDIHPDAGLSSPGNPVYDIYVNAGVQHTFGAGQGFGAVEGAYLDTPAGYLSFHDGAGPTLESAEQLIGGHAGFGNLIQLPNLLHTLKEPGGTWRTDSHQTLSAGPGFDTIEGANGDTLYGSESSQGGALLLAQSGHETMYGGQGQDTMRGGSGHTTMYAGYANQTMIGGSGSNDFYVSKSTFNNDVIQGGSGINILHLSDLSMSDVSMSTDKATGATTVAFGDHQLTVSNISEIVFKGGHH